MSILIKGMEMPKRCDNCWFFNGDSARTPQCCLTAEFLPIPSDVPTEECPLIELPPHGRLIDADALTTVTEMVNGEWKTYLEVFEIENAPTIIESEEEE